MKYGGTKFRTIFKLLDLWSRNKHNKYFTGSIKGSDHENNLKSMTIDRHNYGLNIRYPGNAFFQLQILLERYSEQKEYRNTLKSEFSEIDEIERMLNLHFSEIHDPDCYIIKENKKNR